MNIGIWGASITYGKCDEEALGWVGRLRRDLLSKREIDVYNYGVCGHTTEDLLARFDIEAAAIRPEIIILSIGMNDSKYTDERKVSLVPLEKFKENVSELVRRARIYTDQVAIVGLTNVDGPLVTPRGSEFRDDSIVKYNAVLEACASEAKIPFVSLFGLFDIHKDMSSDRLHPNANGYEKMYAKIKEELGPFLPLP